jgi:hypothetical protein
MPAMVSSRFFSKKTTHKVNCRFLSKERQTPIKKRLTPIKEMANVNQGNQKCRSREWQIPITETANVNQGNQKPNSPVSET